MVEVDGPGDWGEADALFTTAPGVSLVIFVADCAPVVLAGNKGIGVAHAGWRGAAAGVVSELAAAMTGAGVEIETAALGPMIGPCCFEVGPEVSRRFPDDQATTTWTTNSVDLASHLARQSPVRMQPSPGCTYHDLRFLSHRRLGPVVGPDEVGRMAALAWLEP